MKKKFKIKKDDTVIVIAGKDKGKKGKVLKVYPQKDRIVVQGINMVKKHMRPSELNPKGAIMEIETSLHISNVMYFDPKVGKGVKLGRKKDENGVKRRFSRYTGKFID